MKRRKVIIFFVILVFVSLFVHFVLPRAITQTNIRAIKSIKNKDEKLSRPFSDSLIGKEVSITSFDALRLKAYLTYSPNDTVKGTIILLHGIISRKELFHKVSEQLAIRGFNSLAVDLRAHGESEGTHCTFGVKEKKDISSWIDLLEEEGLGNQPIGIWGQSLGGAVALQTLGTDNRLAFGVVESTFSELETITLDYGQDALFFRLPFLMNYLTKRAGKIAKFDVSEASPIAYCPKITQPMLLVHGNQDKKIDIKYGKANFAALASNDKQLIEVEDANHSNVWQIEGEDYFLQVYSFLANQVRSADEQSTTIGE